MVCTIGGPSNQMKICVGIVLFMIAGRCGDVVMAYKWSTCTCSYYQAYSALWHSFIYTCAVFNIAFPS